MNVTIREYRRADLPAMAEIWNEIVEDGTAFPQEEVLTPRTAEAFFAAQSFTGVAEQKGGLLGLYILHPNNVGRCGHISNASYAVRSSARGQHVGEQLVRHSLKMGSELGFRILQFNAVVKNNHGAVHLYEKLGFQKIGEVPGGFRMQGGGYEDIILFYHVL